MTKEELVELVEKVINADGTEEEIDAYIEVISQAVPHPSWTDLVYHSDCELTPEEVVEQALAYKSIRL